MSMCGKRKGGAAAVVSLTTENDHVLVAWANHICKSQMAVSYVVNVSYQMIQCHWMFKQSEMLPHPSPHGVYLPGVMLFLLNDACAFLHCSS